MNAIRLLAIPVILSMVLVGCNPSTSSQPTETDVPAATQASEKVVITFWNGFTGGDRPTFEALFQEFNDTHPNIELKVDIQPWDTLGQKLPAALASGVGPDVSTPDYNVGTIWQYVNSGSIAPLDEIYGMEPGKIDINAMPPEVLEGFTRDGHIWAVPVNFGTLLLYYNKDLLAEAGYAEPPKTMEEFQEYAAKLTKKDDAGNVIQYGIALAENQTIPMWPILIWANGGDLTNDKGCSMLNDPKTVEAIKSWADLIVNEGISPVGLTGGDADNLFAAGKAAFEMNGPWAAGQYGPAGINFDVAPIPVGPAGAVTLVSTTPMVMSASTENKEAAYEFLVWWISKDTQRTLALGAGFPPARTDMADDPAFSENPLLQKFSAAAPYSRLYLPNAELFSQIDVDIFQPAIGRITRGESADVVLQEAHQQLNQLLGCPNQ